jgi:hypothetical protein
MSLKKPDNGKNQGPVIFYFPVLKKLLEVLKHRGQYNRKQ